MRRFVPGMQLHQPAGLEHEPGGVGVEQLALVRRLTVACRALHRERDSRADREQIHDPEQIGAMTWWWELDESLDNLDKSEPFVCTETF
jgi:hypothetical protein